MEAAAVRYSSIAPRTWFSSARTAVLGAGLRAVCPATLTTCLNSTSPPKTTATRYEHDHPGSLMYMDVKKIGRIPDGGGWRAYGRSEKVRGRGIGYEYVHSVVDDHSRLGYSEILTDEKGASCAGFLLRAAAYLAGHGLTRIQRVMTDNHHLRHSHRRPVTGGRAALPPRGW